MKTSNRVTFALDQDIERFLAKMKEETNLSTSEIIRRALRLYHDYRKVVEGSTGKKIPIYLDLLMGGEHVILDVDHWLLLLHLIETSPEKERFWEGCRLVAKSHGEQLSKKIPTPQALLERLEACNFFKLLPTSSLEYTLLLTSAATKHFVRALLADFFDAMGFKVEIEEDLSKLRIKIRETPPPRQPKAPRT